MIVQILVKIHSFVLKILSGNEILMKTNWTLNNHKLDVIKINACAKFCQNLFIQSQDIERKRNSDIIQGTQFCNELTKIDV